MGIMPTTLPVIQRIGRQLQLFSSSTLTDFRRVFSAVAVRVKDPKKDMSHVKSGFTKGNL
jgi:hypothetical protein